MTNKAIDQIKIFECNYINQMETQVNEWLMKMEDKYGHDKFEIVNINLQRNLSVLTCIQYRIYED